MADKLLPCPFCGEEPKLRTHRSGEDSMEAYVECPSCEIRTTYYEDAYAPTADAIGAWNRRAPSPQSNLEMRHGPETGEAMPDNASETTGAPDLSPVQHTNGWDAHTECGGQHSRHVKRLTMWSEDRRATLQSASTKLATLRI